MNVRALQEPKKSAIIALRNKIGGVTMANRDYHKEYERDKSKKKIMSIQVTPELFDAFTAKAELNGIAKNAILKACAEAYTYGNLIIDENGKPQILK
nr:MAG TPA: repressor [Bacteriophage sp.]